jgi:hypothetical protein
LILKGQSFATKQETSRDDRRAPRIGARPHRGTNVPRDGRRRRAERTPPPCQNIRRIAAIAAKRIATKTGQPSVETRDDAVGRRSRRDPRGRAWGIENNLHWQLDTAFDEDRCRTRKDFSPLNLAIVRPIVFNILEKDRSKLSLERNRRKASVNPSFRTELLAC